MKTRSTRSLLPLLLVAVVAACGEDPDGAADSTGDAPDPTTGDTMNPSTMTTMTTMDPTMDPTMTTMDPTMDPTEDPSTTRPGPDTSDTDPDTSDTDPDTTTGDDGYGFADDPYDAYVQIDRHGAVEAGTAGIAAPEGLGFNPGSDISIRDDYNASNPAEDAAGMWLPEIGASVTFFHEAFDDDLMDLGLVVATVEESVAQAGPVIAPDTIKYDPSLPTSYPNGRRLEDPVVDLTLAAVLLRLGPAQPLDLFASLPLNPPANDVPFGAEFPYLAPPHL